MRLEDELEEEIRSKNKSKMYITGILTASFFVLFVLIVVLITNPDKFGKKKTVNKPETETETKDDFGGLISGSSLVSDDLDIWEEYKETESATEAIAEPEPEASSEEEKKDENANKTKIVHADGTEEWVQINKYIAANEYDNSFFTMGNGRMAYYEDGRKVSFTGINVTGYKDYIDFHELKDDGVDFVMLRLGQRGYTTGTLQVDTTFYDYYNEAQNAGLDVGVTFYSQAVSLEEAVEEADFVVESLKDISITYPVVFDMEAISFDDARTDALSKEQKTQIAKAFLEEIEKNGYIGCLYGNKEWLLSKLNFVVLSDFDIWYKEAEEIPDFPYRYHMWQYGKGDVTGISGDADLIISMVDYSVK